MTIAGKYIRSSVENQEAFLAKLGLPEDKIKAILAATTTVEITDLEGGKFRVVRTLPNSTMDTTFELGKAFDDKTPGGKDCKATITKAGEDWAIVMEAEGKTLNVTRKFTADSFEDTMSFDGVTAKAAFKKQ